LCEPVCKPSQEEIVRDAVRNLDCDPSPNGGMEGLSDKKLKIGEAKIGQLQFSKLLHFTQDRVEIEVQCYKTTL